MLEVLPAQSSLLLPHRLPARIAPVVCVLTALAVIGVRAVLQIVLNNTSSPIRRVSPAKKMARFVEKHGTRRDSQSRSRVLLKSPLPIEIVCGGFAGVHAAKNRSANHS